MPGVVSRDSQTAASHPKSVHARIPPERTDFVLLIQSAEFLQLVSYLISADFAHGLPEVCVSSREDDYVGFELTPVIELQPLLGEPLDWGIALDFDLAVDDKLASSVVWRRVIRVIRERQEWVRTDVEPAGTVNALPSSSSLRRGKRDFIWGKREDYTCPILQGFW